MTKPRSAGPSRAGAGSSPRTAGRTPSRGRRTTPVTDVSRPPAPPGPAEEGPSRRPTLTGRGAIVLLVLAALVVSLALPLRAFIEQRQRISDLRAELDRREAAVVDLEAEKDRWDDPAFVTAEARRRLFFVMPGETAYTVLDETGSDEPPLGETPKPEADDPVPWFTTLWGSVQAADG